MHDTGRALRLGATASALLAIAACTPFTAGTPDANVPGTTHPVPGVPSGPSFYDRPEPTFVATDPPVTSAPTPGAPVSVFVTHSGWDADTGAVEAGGYIPGVIESDGTCTLTLTLGDRTATTSLAAQPDATTTSCGNLSIAGTRVSTGTWRAVLSYRSPEHAGASEPVEVRVP